MIIGIILLVDFNESVKKAIDTITNYDPILLMSLGLNAHTHGFEIEKIAVNQKRYLNDDGL